MHKISYEPSKPLVENCRPPFAEIRLKKNSTKI